MTIRTRIAPSPTGYMHIGTLRTVMFDYFLARQANGQFIVRIEDTDQARLVPGALESLLETLQKLDIDYDEGPILNEDGSLGEKGAYGPYIQSKRLKIYKPYADELVKQGHAYVCFCSKERLEEMRAAQTAAKVTPKYDRLCLKLTPEEISERIKQGEPHVIRMKIPEGTVSFEDAIRGKIEFNLADVDDQIIVKSDGFASYHLAVVVDDHLMKISHVLRGEEWISSTPKQIVLHDMLGWTMPVYAHVPLILNPDRTKLSKRKGDVSVEGFLEKGYLPDALINFISTLGFNPTADKEVYSREELVKLFDLSRVNSSGAIMNLEKLDWMNHHYLNAMGDDDLLKRVSVFAPHLSLAQDTVKRAILIEKPRAHTLRDLVRAGEEGLALGEYDSALLVWKKADAADAKKQLADVLAFLESTDDKIFADISLLEKTIKEYIKDKGLPTGNVLWPLRVALSGKEKSASPFELLWALGKDESLRRVKGAMEKLKT